MRWQAPFLLLLILLTVWIVKGHIGFSTETGLNFRRPVASGTFQHDEGAIFGTIYHATYECDHSLQAEYEEEMRKVDRSLSMFNPESTISLINQGKSAKTDSLFRVVFRLSQAISQTTDGAFDITVAPLVNAWGFGFKNGALPDSAQVDSLRQLIGYQHIRMQADTIVKDRDGIVLDCSAVAKGFGCDVVANYFKRKGISNYMIEIGGEIVVGGHNDKKSNWKIAVQKPVDDSTCVNNEQQTILEMTDCGMATSGNYRNFHIDANGQKRAHTIDPHTGYPVQHNILSSTVVAPTCAEADAYATSFMVMGLDKAKQILAKKPELKAYFIYTDDKGNNKVWSKGI